MIKHTHTEKADINFHQLEERLCYANTHINKAMEKMEEVVAALEGPTLLMATGGSKCVAYYLQSILDYRGIISEVVEPRTMFHKPNMNAYRNLIAISNSGKTNGLEQAFMLFPNQKHLITASDITLDDCNIISYQEAISSKEKSFVSLATSFIPMLMLLKMTQEEVFCNEQLINMLTESKEFSKQFKELFSSVSGIEILSGYETTCAASVLESNLVETGVCPVVIHDKGSYCHGRSNLKFNYSQQPMIYLMHEEQELDSMLLEVLTSQYDFIYPVVSKGEQQTMRDYDLALKMAYLSREIASDKEIDLCQPEYNPKVIKKVYSYKGEM